MPAEFFFQPSGNLKNQMIFASVPWQFFHLPIQR